MDCDDPNGWYRIEDVRAAREAGERMGFFLGMFTAMGCVVAALVIEYLRY